VTTTEKHLVATAKQVSRLQARTSKALKRVQRAKAKQVKAVANNIRKMVLSKLVAARAALTSIRDTHATAKVAHKISQQVEKSVKKRGEGSRKGGKAKKPRRRAKKLVS